MTREHLEMLLKMAGAKSGENGWQLASEGHHLSLYAAHAGAGLTVSRVEAVRPVGDLLQARTVKGETYVLALEHVFAGAVEGMPAASRKAGFAHGN